MSGVIGPAELEIDQQEHATLITGTADHGRISFTIQIEDSAGLKEEQIVAREIGDAVREVVVDE